MAKTRLFTTPLVMSRITSASRVASMKPPKVKPPPTTPNKLPPKTPIKSAQMARQGNITAIARNLGMTRKAIGSSAMVSSASNSSVTRMVPISAAKAEPDLPITTIAVIRGPSSRVMEMATRLDTNCMAPNLCN